MKKIIILMLLIFLIPSASAINISTIQLTDHKNISSNVSFSGVSQSIAKINDTSLIVAYRRGSSEIDQYSYIVYRISNDVGQTWSDEKLLIDMPFPYSDGYPTITVTDSGNIVIITGYGIPSGETGYNILTSYDGGITFTNLTMIPLSLDIYVPGFSISTLPDGNLFNLFALYNVGDQYAFVSTNEGITWNSTLAYDGGTSEGYGTYSENSCASYKDGKIICLLRHEQGLNIGVLKNSNNGTGTWEFSTITKAVEITPYLLMHGDDIFVLSGRENNQVASEGLSVRRINANNFWNNPSDTYNSALSIDIDPYSNGMQAAIIINDIMYVITYHWKSTTLSNVYIKTINVSDIDLNISPIVTPTISPIVTPDLISSGGGSNTVTSSTGYGGGSSRIDNPNVYLFERRDISIHNGSFAKAFFNKNMIVKEISVNGIKNIYDTEVMVSLLKKNPHNIILNNVDIFFDVTILGIPHGNENLFVKDPIIAISIDKNKTSNKLVKVYEFIDDSWKQLNISIISENNESEIFEFKPEKISNFAIVIESEDIQTKYSKPVVIEDNISIKKEDITNDIDKVSKLPGFEGIITIIVILILYLKKIYNINYIKFLLFNKLLIIKDFFILY